MRKTNLKKLAAVVLSAAMILSMGGMTAFAEETGEETTNTQYVTFTKAIKKETNIYTPAVGTINFTVDVVNGILDSTTGKHVVAYTGGTDGTKTIYAGIVGGVKLKTGASFEVKEEDLTATVVNGTVTLEIDKDKFTEPGIYRYTVTETNPEYEGLTPDTKSYYLDVYVYGDNGSFTFETYMHDGTNKIQKIENTYITNDLSVTKKVSGNQADKNQGFNFTITIQGVKGEKYYVVKKDKTGVTTVQATDPCAANTSDEDSDPEDGAEKVYTTTINVPLKDGESIKIAGLSPSDTYTIVETDYTNDGYKTEIDGADKVNGVEVSGNKTEGRTAAGNVDVEEEKVTYTNSKAAITPTGIALTFAPYALLVALAGVFGFFFLRKKREDEV